MSETAAQAEAFQSLARRLWTYQAERFPIIKTAILLAVFSAAGISLSAHLAGEPRPPIQTFVAVWLVTLILFFQLRAADEYKDLDDDRRYRPERAIPRGLVPLRLVVGIAVAGMPAAAILAVSVTPLLLLPLIATWLWLALMTVEFFVPGWLRARPFLYLVSHMAIMAFMDFFVTAAQWLPHHSAPPVGIWPFVILSCVNGCVLEFGRKTWAPGNERLGVETYSRLLGPRRAAQFWGGLCVLAAILLVVVGWLAGAGPIAAILGILALLPALAAAIRFAVNPTGPAQRRIDLMSGLWVFACYAIVGFAPDLARLWP